MLVIAREHGAQMGTVASFYIDPGAKKLAGLTVRPRAFAKERFVAMKDVLQLGKDVVSISAEEAVVDIPDGFAHRKLKSLQGLWVTTLGGSHLGALADLDVSQDDWTISELTLTGDRALPVNAAEITIGEDEILVPAAYADLVDESAEEKSGFMERVFGKESIADVNEALSRTMKRMGRQTDEEAEGKSEKEGEAKPEAKAKED